jgi:tripartite-type tricarboxylate transporter receptor subunit TctC
MMEQSMSRRFALLCAVLLLPVVVYADDYPNKPLRMIVPFPAGGPTDLTARIIGQKLSEAWHQQVVVDNRGGANGIIGQDAVAKANPDGYTLMVQSIAFSVNPALYKLPYDPIKDFIPVTQTGSTPLMLVVNPAVQAKTLKELIALAKAKPNQLNYASFGQGSIAHLAGEMLKNMAGIQMIHVAYKGVPQSVSDVIAGQCQVMFPTITSALQHVNSGKLRGIAVTSRQRLAPSVSELPTMIEAGLPGYETGTWHGVFLPGGTPQPLVTRLYTEVVRIIKLPDVKELFISQGFEPLGTSTEEFTKFTRAEMEKYAKVVKAANVKVE